MQVMKFNERTCLLVVAVFGFFTFRHFHDDHDINHERVLNSLTQLKLTQKQLGLLPLSECLSRNAKRHDSGSNVLCQKGALGVSGPLLAISKGTRDVQIVLGIVDSGNDENLVNTLQSILLKSKSVIRDSIMVVVMVTESDLAKALRKVETIVASFKTFILHGKLDIVIPPTELLTQLKCKQTNFSIGTCPAENWEAENLAASYLMTYARPRGGYYMQIKSGIQAERYIYQAVISFVRKINFVTKEWIVLDFDEALDEDEKNAFHGKLFKASDVDYVANFVDLFHKSVRPSNILTNYINIRHRRCRNIVTYACPINLRLSKIRYRRSPFKNGKTSKTTNTNSKNMQSSWIFGNSGLPSRPRAMVSTTLRLVRNNSLESFYNGESESFWCLFPQDGDTIVINFVPPIQIEKLRIVSGNKHSPSDIFTNTSVDILPHESSGLGHDFIHVCDFDERGVAEKYLDGQFGSSHYYRSLRMRVTRNIERWAALREISIEFRKQNYESFGL